MMLKKRPGGMNETAGFLFYILRLSYGIINTNINITAKKMGDFNEKEINKILDLFHDFNNDGRGIFTFFRC